MGTMGNHTKIRHPEVVVEWPTEMHGNGIAIVSMIARRMHAAGVDPDDVRAFVGETMRPMAEKGPREPLRASCSRWVTIR